MAGRRSPTLHRAVSPGVCHAATGVSPHLASAGVGRIEIDAGRCADVPVRSAPRAFRHVSGRRRRPRISVLRTPAIALRQRSRLAVSVWCGLFCLPWSRKDAGVLTRSRALRRRYGADWCRPSGCRHRIAGSVGRCWSRSNASGRWFPSARTPPREPSRTAVTRARRGPTLGPRARPARLARRLRRVRRCIGRHRAAHWACG